MVFSVKSDRARAAIAFPAYSLFAALAWLIALFFNLLKFSETKFDFVLWITVFLLLQTGGILVATLVFISLLFKRSVEYRIDESTVAAFVGKKLRISVPINEISAWQMGLRVTMSDFIFGFPPIWPYSLGTGAQLSIGTKIAGRQVWTNFPYIVLISKKKYDAFLFEMERVTGRYQGWGDSPAAARAEQELRERQEKRWKK